MVPIVIKYKKKKKIEKHVDCRTADGFPAGLLSLLSRRPRGPGDVNTERAYTYYTHMTSAQSVIVSATDENSSDCTTRALLSLPLLTTAVINCVSHHELLRPPR